MDHRINTQNSIINYMKEWLRSANKMSSNRKKYKGNNIRKFYICKKSNKSKRLKERESDSEKEWQSKNEE